MMNHKKCKEFFSAWWWVLLSGVLLIVDQLLKYLVVKAQPMFDWGFVRIVLVYNTGSAFSLIQNSNLLLTWIAIIVLGLFIIFAKKIPQIDMPYATIAAAGVVGNLIDRVLRGGVVDFVDLGWWPVFNVADAMIVVGVLILVVRSVIEEINEKKKN